MRNRQQLHDTLIDIAAMQLDFPLTDTDIQDIANEIDEIDDQHWYYCTFRKAYLICLYGNVNPDDKENMDWLPFTAHCTKLRRLCEDFIFPMTSVVPRVIIIRTKPGMEMSHHTDVSIDRLNVFEPKLRLVLKGRERNTLYYINENNEHVHIPESWRAYIMSGAAMHGMANQGQEKYTLCWGEPWTGDDLKNEKFTRYMNDQLDKHYMQSITISGLGKVDHGLGVKDKERDKIISWNEYHNKTN